VLRHKLSPRCRSHNDGLQHWETRSVAQFGAAQGPPRHCGSQAHHGRVVTARLGHGVVLERAGPMVASVLAPPTA